jgi:hypothetical protein
VGKIINGGIDMADIKYEIKETLGELSESTKTWRKELNLISWNDKEAKYDIRDWSPEHEKMGKGVTLSKEELIKLKALLNEINL